MAIPSRFDLSMTPAGRFLQLQQPQTPRPQSQVIARDALGRISVAGPRLPSAGAQPDPRAPFGFRKDVMDRLTGIQPTMGTVPSLPPKKPMSLMDRISPEFGTPASAGLGAAAATGLQMSGYSPTPISTAQGLGAMMQSGMKAFQAAKAAEKQDINDAFARELTLAKIQTERLKGKQPFSGTSMTAQGYNTLIALGPKIASGKATAEEKQAYSLVFQTLSQPEKETRQTDQGMVIVERPAMNLSSFPTPEGYVPDERVVSQKSASFTEVQGKAAGFANRMNFALQDIESVLSEGYDPTSTQDYLAGNLPSVIGGGLVSELGQRFQQSKSDFITAVLRKESGAAINPSEFETEDRKYFPQPNDKPEVIAQKARARARALQAMKAASGPAYDVFFPPEVLVDVPEGSKLLKEIGNKQYYETKGGDILVVDING